MARENLKPKLLAIFENNPNSVYEVSDLVNIIQAEPKHIYTDLQYLVKCKIVTKALPGLNGGRKCTYFKRNSLK